MRQPLTDIVFVFVQVVMLCVPLCAWSQSTEPNPGIQRPVTTQELDQLKRRIFDETRSNIEAMFEYHTETGDPNNRLDFYRAGARLNLKLTPGTLFQVRGTHTPYWTADDGLTESGTNLTFGFKSQPGEENSLQFEVGATRFSTDGQTINGLGAFSFSSGTTTVKFTGSRSNVEESLLSATGVRPASGPFAGELVGLVMDNRFLVDGIVQVLPKLDVFANGGLGIREGSNVESNFFKTLGGGGGYNFIARADDEPVRLARASYSANYLGFEKDLFGFGGASLVDQRGRSIAPVRIGSDGISPIPSGGRPGVGGYFSPKDFFNHVIRGDVAGHPIPGIEYEFSGFVGSQYYTGSSRRPANGVSATVVFWLNDLYSLPVTFVRDNVGPFSQQSLFVRLIARFD